MAETRCTCCKQLVPPEPSPEIRVFCSAWCYGAWTKLQAANPPHPAGPTEPQEAGA